MAPAWGPECSRGGRVVTAGRRGTLPPRLQVFASLEPRSGASGLEEGVHLVQEATPARIAFQDDVIAAFQLDEAGSWNARRHQAPFFERRHGVVATMQNQRWDANAREQVGYVDVVHGLADAHRVLRRGGV